MPKAPNTAPGPLTAAVAEILRMEQGLFRLNDSGLARLAGVDRIAVGRILRGVKVPDIEILALICEALELTLSAVSAAAEAQVAGTK